MAEENNIGASRLLGTNGLQQAVDSLTTQINRLTSTVGASNRSGGTSGGGASYGAAWNNSSNRTGYSANGGGGRFTGGAVAGGYANGGGGNFGNLAGMSRLSAGAAVATGTASALVNYANKYMPTNFQMNYFGSQAAVAGGISGTDFYGANRTARRLVFGNNYTALNATDAAKAGYLNQYTFGAPQFNGQANPAFVTGQAMSRQFAYANPTQGAYGGALAAQETYSSRSLQGLMSLGYMAPFRMGGGRNSMGDIAQSLAAGTFGNQKINMRQFNASIQQGGSLAVNLQAAGRAAGWSQSTIQSYQNIIQGQYAAQNKGMSANKYYSLLGQASNGNKAAINQLAQTTGMGASMFENQRNLNATRLNRQNDILDSLAPAFDNATQAVNKFSEALTSFLQATGLNKVIGGASGTLAPFSNALSGLSGGFGVGVGLLGAARMFGGGGGLLGGLFGRGAAAGGGGLINATRGAGGAFNITSMGGAGASRAAGLIGGLSTGGALLLAQGHSGGGLYQDYLNRKNKQGFSKTDQMNYVMQWIKENKSEALKRGWIDKGGTFNPSHYERILKELNVNKNLTEIAKSGPGRLTNSDGINGGADYDGQKKPSGAAGPSTGGTTSGATAAQVISFASQQLGDPYVWGGVGPDGWDCSGLLQWAFAQAGVKIPRTSQLQQRIGQDVKVSNVQPGDLLFNGNPAHHVAMAIGNGQLIEAPKPGLKVRTRSFSPGEFTNAKRILGSVGNMNDIKLGDDTKETTLNNQGSTIGGNSGGTLGGTSELAAVMAALGGGVGAGAPPAASQSTSNNKLGGGGEAANPKGGNPPGNPQGNVAIGQRLAAQMGWTGNQWKALYNLWMRESGWNEKADNPTSDAYGIPQSLPASKMASAGSDYMTNPETQIKWGLQYIKERYGSPAEAWSFWNRQNPHWYAEGAWNIDQDVTARVHKGEMIIPAQQAETIRQTLVNNTFNPNLQRAAGIGTQGGGITFGDINISLPNTYNGTSQEARDMGRIIVTAMEEQLRLKNLQIGQ